MKNIKVSIIIPVYNVENFLAQCLESVVNQTLKEIEIICVNDGSTDNSSKILERYAEKDKRIIIINKINAGLGAARNTGMEYASGEYIGFLDSDDWVNTEMYGKLYENGKLYNSDIVMCPILHVNEGVEELNRDPFYYNLECFKENFDNCVFSPEQTKDFILNIAVNAINKIYRTEYIKSIGAKFPEGLLFEDVPFFYQTYLNAKNVSLIRDPLYIARVNRSGSITSEVNKRHFDVIEIQNLMIKIFSSNDNYDEYKSELLNKKISRIIIRFFALDEIYRKEFFELIKQDFENMDLRNNELEDLHLGVQKQYKNIIKSHSYMEFQLREENDKLSNTINNLESQNNQTLKSNIQIKSANKKLEQQLKQQLNSKTEEIAGSKETNNKLMNKIKNRNLYFLNILFSRKNNGIKNALINIKGYNAIKKNQLLDTNYYSKNNIDVKSSGMDPILHYMYHGFKEGRKPNPSFDGDYYLKAYRDVKQSNLNPLIHYSLYGMKEGKKTQKSSNLEVKKPNLAKKLIISYCFSPYVDTSAVVMAKRIRDHNVLVDVIQNNMDGMRVVDEKSNLITEKLIEDQILINSRPSFDDWNPIKDFCKKGMEKIDEIVRKKGEYKEIYSRSMFPGSHFLGFEYKIKYPNVKWTAEFSDPLIYDIKENLRNSPIKDREFMEKINRLLSKQGLPKVEFCNLFYLCEYLTYIFADELIFTNENQKEYMISKFPNQEIVNIIEQKSQIKRHPTLNKEFYNLVESDYPLDNNFVNLAYFGVIYETRNLEEVFISLYSLNENYKKKCKIHFFVYDPEGNKELTACSPIRDNLEINPYVSFLEFLNLTTKFDCLIVNDANTKDYKEINPYLPSKLSDYLGSGSDIWAIYEEGSPMSGYNIKYTSIINDVKSSSATLKKIIEDHI